ncbi:MAG: hypothetical protein V9H26_11275 [Verrucomicrobiota bacterium]
MKNHMNHSIPRLLLVSLLVCASLPSAFAAEPAAAVAADAAVPGVRAITVVWRDSGAKGSIVVRRGQMAPGGKGLSTNGTFDCAQTSRLELSVAGVDTLANAERALITVQRETNTFTFFLNDVRRDHPIFIPAFGVAVTEAGDGRTYQQIAAAVQARGLRSNLGQIEAEPEETFERAAPSVRVQKVETWLGLGRDLRLFSVSPRLEWIQPRYPYGPVRAQDRDAPQLQMMLGRGWGAGEDIHRRLEEGVLPILQATKVDEDITYHATLFTSFEQTPLRSGTIRGTHFLVADGLALAHMLTPDQQAEFDRLKPVELNRPEETVLYVRVVATNTSAVPRYAFVKVPTGPRGWKTTPPHWQYKFDGSRGWSQLTNGNVYLVGKLNGRPLPQEEVSLLLFPGELATVEFRLPHQPIPAERAAALAGQDFDARLEEARAYWRTKLDRAAKMRVPDARINEMIQAGLLHLDIITYGLEPKGSLTAHVGIYNAIGSESSPIIQFMDSMGWHDVAGRALQSFLDKQHTNGFMQNLGDYMLETGCVLWSLGEHYRYTRDLDWVRSIKPKMLKSAEYLREWRRRNQREELKGKGYGLLDGKVADPEDPFRSYMLNGYTYLGFARVAEMLEPIDPAEARVWREEAEGLKQDIRISFFETMAKSPVVPLGDGSWVPSVAPWADYSGPVLLQADGGIWYSHGTVTARDSLLGPLYLLFQEVIAPDEPAASFLLSYHNELMTSRNAGFSQPYYSRHDWAHLQRGEVKPFLKTYYNTVASMADRETYTFWEHYFTASPHKTHEEGWFLMQTRWMLYLEKGDTLTFLRGVPRRYLAGGQQIDLIGVATYFGPASLHVATTTDQRRISAYIECKSDRQPRSVEIRLPHPAGLRPQSVKGGTYDATTETVRIESFSGTAEVELFFPPSP